MSEPSTVGRVNVALVADGALALEQLRQRTGMKQVDIVNRAIQIYEFVEAEQRAGSILIVRAADGREQSVRFL